jgi:hypothetical protein
MTGDGTPVPSYDQCAQAAIQVLADHYAGQWEQVKAGWGARKPAAAKDGQAA